MEAFYALLFICAENSPVHGEFPTQRPVTRSFDVWLCNSWLLICRLQKLLAATANNFTYELEYHSTLKQRSA